jgi:hypothetical protein
MKKCATCSNQTDDNARYCHDCQQSIRGAFYLLDAINGRKGSPEGREAVRECLQASVDRKRQS